MVSISPPVAIKFQKISGRNRVNKQVTSIPGWSVRSRFRFANKVVKLIVSAASTIKLELLVRSVSITRLGNITQSHLPSRVSLHRRRQHIFEILHLLYVRMMTMILLWIYSPIKPVNENSSDMSTRIYFLTLPISPLEAVLKRSKAFCCKPQKGRPGSGVKAILLTSLSRSAVIAAGNWWTCHK